MSLELKDIETRKKELQGELNKVESSLVEALKTVETLKQNKFSTLFSASTSWDSTLLSSPCNSVFLDSISFNSKDIIYSYKF